MEGREGEEVFCWATIGFDGLFHFSHTHGDSAVSGVYYSQVTLITLITLIALITQHYSHIYWRNITDIQVPSGAGALVLSDPRGPRPPFDGRFIHQPSAGELILFPSWLSHEVTPTINLKRNFKEFLAVNQHDIRVSWSCNLPGDWETTSDVSFVI